MSHFKKLCITFSILKLQKSDAYQNGVEFRHKPNGYDAMWPPPLFCLPPPLDFGDKQMITFVYIIAIKYTITINNLGKFKKKIKLGMIRARINTVWLIFFSGVDP